MRNKNLQSLKDRYLQPFGWEYLYLDAHSDDRERREAALQVILAPYIRRISAAEFCRGNDIEPYTAIDQDGRIGTLWCRWSEVERGFWDFRQPVQVRRPEEMPTSGCAIALVENDEEWEIPLGRKIWIEGVFCPD